jgi:transketolase
VGERLGEVPTEELVFVPRAEIDRARDLAASAELRAALFADLCRLNALYMIARAGSGHIGSSFSSLDIVSWLFLAELRTGPSGDLRDLYFSSKGHDVPGLYAVLIGLGRLPEEALHTLRRLDGLPGHPDVGTPGIVTNTGSLGMGISKGKGFVRANRLRSSERRVFVLTGDGELQEGQIWESLGSAATERMHELTVIVDCNKLQSDTSVRVTSDLGDLAGKLGSFGWRVERVDGHDLSALAAALRRLHEVRDAPKAIIADTIKGRGVSFMEHTAMPSEDALYRFHSGAPDADSYRAAVAELRARIDERLAELGGAPLRLATTAVPTRPAPARSPTLVAVYGEALLARAERDPTIVALDADLALDCALIDFKRKLPERFVECGIAEQDMVSQAGALALAGFRPVVHSFASFLSARANEQIGNNASEGTRVVYVGALAGLLPGGPGHSHQAVRDVAALGAIPGLVVLAPSSAAEVRGAVAFAFGGASESVYLRLASVPVDLPIADEVPPVLAVGRGRTVRAGSDVLLLTYGPVLLAETLGAASLLGERHGLSVAVVSHPWVNRVDVGWLVGLARGRRLVATIDDHLVHGGLGDRVAAALAESEATREVRLARFGVEGVPRCGGNAEVLHAHGLDSSSLADRIARRLGMVAGRAASAGGGSPR